MGNFVITYFCLRRRCGDTPRFHGDRLPKLLRLQVNVLRWSHRCIKFLPCLIGVVSQGREKPAVRDGANHGAAAPNPFGICA